MAYTALARRYRSQSFGDVIGQEPIAQTLRNAIEAGRVHHAYLFTGTRGVGKTSMARLLARALNAPATISDCPPATDADGYPPEEVQRRMAEAIMRGDDLNVIEIDGASNRSVEDARQLIANAGLAPTDNARFKVYIIDEVHMLTKDAFNTLLKVMEEPPAHLKFILCTTEPEKVLPTIQSRCQRFDFRNIPAGRIAEHVEAVLKTEQVEAEPQVVFEIARLGNGSMRDALSLLDRLLAIGVSPLTGKLLEQMLGLPDRQVVVQLGDAIAGGDVAATLGAADEMMRRGISQDQFTQTLIEHLRELLVVGACGAQTELVELDEATKQQLAEQAKKFDTPALVHAIALMENVARNAKGSSTPRALLDAALARLALAEHYADAAALAAGAPGAVKKKIAAPPARRAENQSSNDKTQTPAPAAPAAKVDIGPDLWRAAMRWGGDNPRYEWMGKLQYVAVAGQTVTLRLLPGHRSLFGFAKGQSEPLASLLSELAGTAVKVAIEPPAGEEDEPAAPAPAAPDRLSPQARNEAMNLPLVRQAAELFDARVVKVQDEDAPPAQGEPTE